MCILFYQIKLDRTLRGGKSVQNSYNLVTKGLRKAPRIQCGWDETKSQKNSWWLRSHNVRQT